jgi:general secretion pathway protein K
VKDRRGFALVAALWLLIAFSAIGLELGLRARTQRLGAANAVEGAQAAAAAWGGLDEVRARLASRMAAARSFRTADPNILLDPWGRPDSMSVGPMPVGAARVMVIVRDAGATLHLNLGTERELLALLSALRIDFGQADRLAQAIVDWRDPDDLRRGRGAERDDYAKQGRAVRPANRAFGSISELNDVMGMTPALYERVRPFLSLRGTGRINVNAAPRPVLLTLPGMSDALADLIIARRNNGRPVRRLDDLLLELPEGPRALLQARQMDWQNRAVFETRELMVTSEGRLEGSPVRVRVQGHLVRAGDQAILVWSGREM